MILLNTALTFCSKNANYSTKVLIDNNKFKISDSVLNSNLNPNPWYITGITDGDGSFVVSISPVNLSKIRWRVNLHYVLTAEINKPNLIMLNKILSYFQDLGCVGRIITENNVYRFRFDGFKNALIIKEHFIKYPLLTYKLVHFNLWVTVLDKVISSKKNTFNFYRIKWNYSFKKPF